MQNIEKFQKKSLLFKFFWNKNKNLKIETKPIELEN